ncbi:Ankyrin repeat family protein [Theobroma cacao]|uniref:Ankyrin repeat family protein n=1 Tax=Theobroma cacao TaxID=3641 RepID=A0A061G2Y7_THECC|nr:Ankyrin repeat family protein [Theobroma cacao]
MDDRLIEASQQGDIDVLYELIRVDAHVLRRIDEIMFVDTPLHIAASSGHASFVMEMMTLMPSFAQKLNKSGLSPMHLAMLNGNLEVCHEDALKWKVKIPNRKDDQGKTVLDIAASHNQLEFIKLLSEINAQNSKGRRLSASSTIQHRVKLFLRTIVKKMQYCGRNRDLSKASSPASRKTLTNYLRSKTSFDEKFAVFITRHKLKISDNARSALLVVVGLLVAATFPAIFSLPGSVRQGDNENPSTVAVTSSTASGRPPLAGTVELEWFGLSEYSWEVIKEECARDLGLFWRTIKRSPPCCNLFNWSSPPRWLSWGDFDDPTSRLVILLRCMNIISPDDGVVRMVDSLLLTSMYMAVVFVRAMHEGGKRNLRRLCYSTD